MDLVGYNTGWACVIRMAEWMANENSWKVTRLNFVKRPHVVYFNNIW